jgi:hypothetical protein
MINHVTMVDEVLTRLWMAACGRKTLIPAMGLNLSLTNLPAGLWMGFRQTGTSGDSGLPAGDFHRPGA